MNPPAANRKPSDRGASSANPSFVQRLRSKPRLLIALALCGAVLLTGIRVSQWLRNPNVYFLDGETEARWIRSYHKFNLGVHNYYWPRDTAFRYDMDLPEPVSHAKITVQAFRLCKVWLDGQLLFSTPDDMSLWKQRHEIELGNPLSPGRHQLLIMVHNQAAHPCLWVSSDALGITSGGHWQTLEEEGDWRPAILATDPATSVADQVQEYGYPDVVTSFRQVWPGLAVVFALAFAWTWTQSLGSLPQTRSSVWRLSPSRLRWILLAAWLVLAINNIGRIPATIGFDVKDHLAYVQFVVENHSVPLASDGWQMFQSPLIYLLAAPFYSLCASFAEPETCLKIFRIFPLLCGMAQIEIVYRAARAVFPERDDLQLIATTVGGMMPVNLYMSQSFGNEPLAGFWTSLLVLSCLSLLVDPQRERKMSFFALLGVLWGLALLSKVTPLILGPLIIAVIFLHGWSGYDWLRIGVIRTAATFSACFAVAGWYYVRNWVYLGRLFVGGWDPSRGIKWWQDPSYRTWQQLTTFGKSLTQPIYSGTAGFWDGIYSSLWTDGFLSGTFQSAEEFPWNMEWMEIGAWLSLLPMACIVIGVAALWRRDFRPVLKPMLFALAAVGIYFAAILDLYVQVPVYGASKSSYALGLLPCFGLLAAVGASWFLRFRIIRALFFAALTCWAFAGYVAYFCVQ